MIKKRVWEILELSEDNDSTSKYFDYFISILIGLNVVAIILETEKSFYEGYTAYFLYFEVFSIAIFTAEYLLRFWSCVSTEAYREPILGRIKYLLTPMAVIDLIAIAPFYLTFIVADTRILRILRFLRLFRTAKHFRHSKTFHIIVNTIDRKKSELLSSLVLMLSLLLICSTGVYFVENEAQPEKFSSILASMWWAVATLTTVGYGDIYPITILGKILGAISAIFGIGLFALPAGLLASGFSDASEEEQSTCPHCGKEI
ncbi:ion transporter [Deltaproteobacteria bacterium]|nr:ion transporter [Deltaproteobacteria bacterium]